MVLSESRLQVRRTQQWPDSGAPLSRSFMTTGQQGFSLKLTRLEEASVYPHTDSEKGSRPPLNPI